MIEIRFHGRGGQGTVVASILAAKAFFNEGYYVQTFPLFGVERRGAPVEAYLRLDQNKIMIRSNVYSPDHIVVLDFKLINTVDVAGGLKPGGWILINASKAPDNMEQFSGFRVACIDAGKIAVSNNLGTRTQPMINTAMIGAFARILEMPALDAVLAAIEDEILVKTELNIKAAKEAYDEVQILNLEF